MGTRAWEGGVSDEQNMPVGLWTDGQQCLVLASVRLAFWASKIADHDNDVDHSKAGDS